MKDRKNYYEVLHVQFDAPAEIIKGSYRAPMQQKCAARSLRRLPRSPTIVKWEGYFGPSGT